MTVAILLAGGQGTRLQAVWQGLPKALAPVAGRPFIDYLITHLARRGAFSRIVLAAGHKAESLAVQCAAIADVPPIIIQTEPSSLGTGGALMHTLATLRARPLSCSMGTAS